MNIGVVNLTLVIAGLVMGLTLLVVGLGKKINKRKKDKDSE